MDAAKTDNVVDRFKLKSNMCDFRYFVYGLWLGVL